MIAKSLVKAFNEPNRRNLAAKTIEIIDFAFATVGTGDMESRDSGVLQKLFLWARDEIAWPALVARPNQIVPPLPGGVKPLLAGRPVELSKGTAKLPSANRIAIALNAGGTEAGTYTVASAPTADTFTVTMGASATTSGSLPYAA
mgnify:CR=1 FL=1